MPHLRHTLVPLILRMRPVVTQPPHPHFIVHVRKHDALLLGTPLTHDVAILGVHDVSDVAIDGGVFVRDERRQDDGHVFEVLEELVEQRVHTLINFGDGVGRGVLFGVIRADAGGWLEGVMRV